MSVDPLETTSKLLSWTYPDVGYTNEYGNWKVEKGINVAGNGIEGLKKIRSNIVDFGKIEMKNMVEIVNSVKASANSAKGFAVSLR